MILADKIINERKKNGWSQEELAEKLSVSRQSVSKWEGAQSVPDLQKVIQMAEIFGVSTDYLLKDELEPEEGHGVVLREDSEHIPPLRKVTMEEASKYLSVKKTTAPAIALAISLCILSPVTLIFLIGLADSGIWNLSETLAAGIGVVTLLLMIACAVGIFIFTGTKINEFDYLEKIDFETEYGVTGMAKERKQNEQGKYMSTLISGVILCILCPVPLLATAIVEAPDYIVTSMVCVLLIMVAIAVNLIVSGSAVTIACKVLLCEEDYSSQQKKVNRKMAPISGVFWLLATAVFLGFSFYTNDWSRTWIVWPVAAILYVIIINIAKMVMKVEE